MTPRQRTRLTRGVLYVMAGAVLVLAIVRGDWESIRRNFLDVDVMRDMLPEVITVAAKNTIIYTVLSFVFGLILALILALMKLSTVLPYRAFAIAYIELFRGLPALITLMLFGYAVPIAFDIRIPGGRMGPAVVGLSVVAGAYMAETIRGGIEAVPRGQSEAARSLGMSTNRTMFSIVLPQAFRIMIPPLTNEMVLLIKDTSLFYVLGSTALTKELTKFARDFMVERRNATPLTVAAIVYLLITLPLTYLVRRMERNASVSR